MTSESIWFILDPSYYKRLFENNKILHKDVTAKDVVCKFVAKEIGFQCIMYGLKKVIKNRSICTRISGALIAGSEEIYRLVSKKQWYDQDKFPF